MLNAVLHPPGRCSVLLAVTRLEQRHQVLDGDIRGQGVGGRHQVRVVERQVDRTLTEMVDEEKKNFGELLKASWLINFND